MHDGTGKATAKRYPQGSQGGVKVPVSYRRFFQKDGTLLSLNVPKMTRGGDTARQRPHHTHTRRLSTLLEREHVDVLMQKIDGRGQADELYRIER
jgi:hypothetical protein